MAPRKVCLVLSGGVALGAYQAGAYAVLHKHPDLWPQRLAGSSIGAVNAAVIAGSRPKERLDRLRGLWEAMSAEPGPLGTTSLARWAQGSWRHAVSWASVLQTRFLGRPGVFQPRVPELMLRNVTSVYDMGPFRASLSEFIDFDRVNGGEVRVSVVATDVETGQGVVFDTHNGDRIDPDHLLASCGFLPDFAPVEIDGRLLGDGGLVANAPFESVLLDESERDELLCFIVDLFSPDAGRPTTLEEAAGRRWDLMFGNQSRLKLESIEREYRLRWALARLARQLGPDLADDPDVARLLAQGIQRAAAVLHLRYRAPVHEPGPEKPFDFSRASVDDRWEAGSLDMEEAIRFVATAPPQAGISVHQVRR